MTVRIGINGFGSIGRRVLRIALENHDLDVVAINDLSDPKTMAHLLKYDSNYGTLNADVFSSEGVLMVGRRKIRLFKEKDPAQIPWGKYGVDIVIESTGVFTEGKKAGAHLQAGAKKVIITAPAKNPDLTIVKGVNDAEYDPDRHHVISNASCTTNCLAPIAMVLDRHFGIENGLMCTVHSFTNDQQVLDYPHKDLRRARSVAQAIIPTTTGAAAAVAEVLPQLHGKLTGLAMRVPTPAVSVVDFSVQLRRKVCAEEINSVLKKAGETYLSGILTVSDLPLVSIDFKGMTHSVAVDTLSTQAVGQLVKVIGWYDNEWGYSNRVVELAAQLLNRTQAHLCQQA